MSTIIDVHGRQVLDSRGNPTVEVEVHLEPVPEAGPGNRLCPEKTVKPLGMGDGAFGLESPLGYGIVTGGV